MSCLITKKPEAIRTGQPLPAQRASDDVKLCTCQIRTCAGEGEHVFASGRLVAWRAGGGGVLPYMCYMGMCRREGYGFQAVYSRIGYINQSIWV